MAIDQAPGTNPDIATWIRVGSLAEMLDGEARVVSGTGHSIAIFARTDQGEWRVWAIDNRCPHMGFPLSRGTICDGVLTCHWHHARFELGTGGTFDPFADDVAVHATHVVDDIVYVDPMPVDQADRLSREETRLRTGLEQGLNLVLAKSVLGLVQDEDSFGTRRALRVGANFGATQRRAGWGPGLTILTAMTNVLDRLDAEDRPLGLFHGLVHVSDDASGAPPRFSLAPLPTDRIEMERLRLWFRDLIEVRNSDGAERVLATAIASGATPAQLGEMLMAAATDHVFVSGGHTLDFINKAVELLGVVGSDQAASAFPSLVRGLAGASRSEEQNAWRSPIDLVALTRQSIEALSGRLARPRSTTSLDLSGLSQELLGDDPRIVVSAIDRAFDSGATPADVALALATAAAWRVARFATSNEFGDWITVLHTFTYCNALLQGISRTPTPEVVRGVYHGAISIYLDRFLNVPAARLPDGRTDPGATSDNVRGRLLDLLDRQGSIEPAATLVDGYLRRGQSEERLWAALGAALLREDAEFHSYQMYEAGARVFDRLNPIDPDLGRMVAVAVARYLAAHAPTQREMLQTARIAMRLRLGDED